MASKVLLIKLLANDGADIPVVSVANDRALY